MLKDIAAFAATSVFVYGVINVIDVLKALHVIGG